MKADTADGGKRAKGKAIASVRLGNERRERVEAEAKRQGVTPSAMLRRIVDDYFARKDRKETYGRIGEYLQQLTNGIHEVRQDTKEICRIEEAMRAFHEEFKASLVSDDDDDEGDEDDEEE
jgi:predicted DNA-binding protein